MKIKPLVQSIAIFLLLAIIFSCNITLNNNQPAANTVDVYTKSSALNAAKSKEVNTTADWIFDQPRVITEVRGVRGVFTNIWLRGEGDTGSEWRLFDGEAQSFDLSQLQKIIEIETPEVYSPGTLNTIVMGIKYLEMDLRFKETDWTIKIIWGADENATAKSGDILVLDKTDSQFKWVTLDTRELTATRPADGNVVFLNTFGLNNGTKTNLDSFVLDNFSNAAYLIDPPPWSPHTGEEGGRLDTFFTIAKDTMDTNLEIVIDLSFENSAIFTPTKNIDDPGNNNQAYTTEQYFFSAGNNDQNGSFLQTLEATPVPYSDPGFDLLDILPGLIYPEVYVHVQIQEPAE